MASSPNSPQASPSHVWAESKLGTNVTHPSVPKAHQAPQDNKEATFEPCLNMAQTWLNQGHAQAPHQSKAQASNVTLIQAYKAKLNLTKSRLEPPKTWPKRETQNVACSLSSKPKDQVLQVVFYCQ
ncbi:hypothetical protein PIB30_079504 [Stylosanthes scabra]|uniref:Uncharacterized protein n=1 Tax=Stylosanthes scabra TaxID=79078 RepID=A0ABU6TRU6_9FABA|nr:hypothetical protein [Stylosanthes scabra]